MGFDPVVAPILALRPLAWQPPDPAGFDALLFTSANAARLGGSGLDRLRQLRSYAVGDATGAAVAAAGFDEIRIGSGDAAEVAALAAADGVSRLLHLCGREHKPLASAGVAITSCIVYAADTVAPLPASAIQALRGGAIVLLHSARAASHLATLVDSAGISRDRATLVAISEATAAAAGQGWRQSAAAARPREDALLELAAKLCKTDAGGGTGTR
jgi:uroporphyrinogen-III synthase